MGKATLTTAVIGAGPAGLLFAVVGRLLHEREGGDAWNVRVYDKRASYARTHRLRMGPEPYRAIQRAVDDARFDAFIAFLDEHDFAPEVNALEERLEALLAAVGVKKELLSVGTGPDELSLSGLRRKLEDDQLLEPGGALTIVGADSVHSTVRELVRGELEPERQTHERIARLRVVGDALPRRLGAISQVRLSKVLGSVVDYRLNRNGFAEVDLLLVLVRRLGATPKEPVALSASALGKLRAPLFRAIVEHLAGGGEAKREVLLYSTFQLEHAVMPKLAFDVPELGGAVFLLGDAGISLPFQRGMACLAACALSLARVHVELAKEPARKTELIRRYDADVAEIKRRELGIVKSRARLVHTLREVVRVSALLPFPIQSWWLRATDESPKSSRLSIWFFLNVAVALSAVSLTAVGWLASSGSPLGSWLTWLSLPAELAGGVVYHSALAFEDGAHKWVRRVWELQIAAALAGGIALAAERTVASGHLALTLAPLWWLLLGAAFVIGLYAFEGVVTRWFASAGLSFADAPREPKSPPGEERG